MALPVLKTPTYTITIPSTKKQVKYRPFLVREEKIMLLVKESKDPKEMLNAMKDVIKSCTFDVVDPNTLAVFDIEYIFLQLRSKSVGEHIELVMKCTNTVGEDSTPCGCKIDFDIDISKINVSFPKDHSNIVMVDDKIGITFKYPSVDTILELEEGKSEFDILVSLIDNIFDADNVYDAKDSSHQQLSDFIESLTNKQYKKIMTTFFNTMPVLEHVHKYKCPKCDNEGSYTFRGISDFF